MGYVFSAYLFFFLWLWEYLYFIRISSSNLKYDRLSQETIVCAVVCIAMF